MKNSPYMKISTAAALMSDLKEKCDALEEIELNNGKHSIQYGWSGLREPIKNEIKIIRRLLNDFAKELSV